MPPARAARAAGGRRNGDGSTGGACSRRLLLPASGLDWSGGDALGGPQARTSSAWVGGDLGVRRGQRRSGDEAKTRRPAADADRQLGRADAALPLGVEEALDDAVLERVVPEDDEPAARPQEVNRGGQPVLECIKLLVDGDSECLEDTGRGVDPAAARRPSPGPCARRARPAPRRSRPARSRGR